MRNSDSFHFHNDGMRKNRCKINIALDGMKKETCISLLTSCFRTIHPNNQQSRASSLIDSLIRKNYLRQAYSARIRRQLCYSSSLPLPGKFQLSHLSSHQHRSEGRSSLFPRNTFEAIFHHQWVLFFRCASSFFLTSCVRFRE